MLKGFHLTGLISACSPKPASFTCIFARLSKQASRRPVYLFNFHPVRYYHNTSTMARTYQEALRLLNSLQSNFAVTSLFNKPAPSASNEPKPDLNAQAIPEMLHWLKRAGYTPEDLLPLKTIHVAGTKGKGSVTAFCTTILLEYPIAGRVGTYRSPHLVTVRERILLDGMPISQELFTKYFFELWDRFEASTAEAGEADVTGPQSKPFYFRYLTIMAWHVFLKEGVKSMIMECGIGGEYDATNVIPAEAVTAAVVTQLGIDHVAMLGDTIGKIAWHKAGIFKHAVRAFTLQDNRDMGYDTAMRVLRSRAVEKGADLLELLNEFETLPAVHDPKLGGAFQSGNMILATAATREHLVRLGERESLEGYFKEVEKERLKVPWQFTNGLENAWLPGRAQVFLDEGEGYHMDWCLDGAHTKESIEAVSFWWMQQFEAGGYRVLLFNQQERNGPELLRQLWEKLKWYGKVYSDRNVQGVKFNQVIFTRNELHAPDPQPEGYLDVQRDNCIAMKEILEDTSADTVVTIASSVTESVNIIRQLARTQAAENQQEEQEALKVLVTGSFHLVGAVLRCINPDAED